MRTKPACLTALVVVLVVLARSLLVRLVGLGDVTPKPATAEGAGLASGALLFSASATFLLVASIICGGVAFRVLVSKREDLGRVPAAWWESRLLTLVAWVLSAALTFAVLRCGPVVGLLELCFQKGFQAQPEMGDMALLSVSLALGLGWLSGCGALLALSVSAANQSESTHNTSSNVPRFRTVLLVTTLLFVIATITTGSAYRWAEAMADFDGKSKLWDALRYASAAFYSCVLLAAIGVGMLLRRPGSPAATDAEGPRRRLGRERLELMVALLAPIIVEVSVSLLSE